MNEQLNDSRKCSYLYARGYYPYWDLATKTILINNFEQTIGSNHNENRVCRKQKDFFTFHLRTVPITLYEDHGVSRRLWSKKLRYWLFNK